MLNDDGDDVEEEERMKRKREEQIEKEREERLKHLNQWKVTYSQALSIIFITIAPEMCKKIADKSNLNTAFLCRPHRFPNCLLLFLF